MTEKILTIGRPNPRQREFLACEKKYVAFGGARGGGKSWAVRTKAKLLALRYPRIRLLLVRRTYQELEANHIRFLRRELANLAEYRATARQFAFPNGSVLDFGYCAADGDMDRYQGAEYDVIFLDGLSAAAAGPAPAAAGRLAGRQVGRVPGAGIPGVHQRSGPLSGPAVHPCHRPL